MCMIYRLETSQKAQKREMGTSRPQELPYPKLLCAQNLHAFRDYSRVLEDEIGFRGQK